MGSESGASERLTPKSTSHKNPPNDGQTLDKKMRKPKAVFAWKKRGRSASALAKFQIEIDQNLLQTAGVDNFDPGPFLLRLTRDMVSSGENPQKAPELALRATKSFEEIMNRKCSTKQEAFWRRNMDPLILTAPGRLDDAIEILDCVVGMRETKLGAANPDVDDEKQRLVELLKEAGRVRNPYH